MRYAVPGAVLVLSMGLAGGASASQATFSRNPHPAKASQGGTKPSAILAPATITESSDPVTITSGNSVSCNNGVGHTLNDYGRNFHLASFPALNLPAFTVQSVVVGVEQATGAGGTQPITLRLAEGDGNIAAEAAPAGTVLSTDNVNITDQALTLFTINVATPPTLTVATDDLVFDLTTPDGQAAGNLFFIGSNAAPETAPSFLQAAACGVATFTATAGIGFPNMHIVVSVSGNTVPVELQTFSIQ